MRGSIVALVLLGGCTLGRLDGLTGGAGTNTGDASVVVEAGVEASAGPSDASAEAGDAAPVPVTLLSYSFDDLTTCNDTSFNSTLAESMNGRTDGHACKVCGQNASADSFSYSIEVPGAVAAVGARYHVTAWYRNPAAGATAMNVAIAVRSFFRQPYNQVEVSPTFGTTGADWRRIDAELVLTKPADAVDVYIGESYGAGVCFVFDDLVVTRLD